MHASRPASRTGGPSNSACGPEASHHHLASLRLGATLCSGRCSLCSRDGWSRNKCKDIFGPSTLTTSAVVTGATLRSEVEGSDLRTASSGCANLSSVCLVKPTKMQLGSLLDHKFRLHRSLICLTDQADKKYSWVHVDDCGCFVGNRDCIVSGRLCHLEMRMTSSVGATRRLVVRLLVGARKQCVRPNKFVPGSDRGMT